MKADNSPIQRLAGHIGFLLGAPVLLAWLATQSLPLFEKGTQSVALLSSYQSLLRVLLVGPLLETALLMLSALVVARVLAQRQPDVSYNVAICTGIICLSFVTSHVLQRGVAALASLPMALLLSLGAAYAVKQPGKIVLVRYGFALFTMHALYNSSLLGCVLISP